MNPIHFSSASAEHYTPPEVVALAKEVLCGITLDPCAEPKQAAWVVPARVHYTREDDGLSREWRGTVYMNPPYGRVIGKWVEKFVAEYAAGHMVAGLALLPARTDTRWFNQLFGAELCFIRGRLTFGAAQHPAPFPSVLVYYGPDPGRFRVACRVWGPCYRQVT